MPKQENPQGRKPDNDRSGINYMKYAGMAFQMGFIILVCALIGQQLDAKVETAQPYFTVVLSLFGIFAALYITLKDLFVKK